RGGCAVRWAAPALLLVALLAPRAALAFSDPLTFARKPLAAGGGGRWFTGSPADGFSCNVCHEGGPQPALNITGLPAAGYQPAARYEVVVSWDAGIEKFACALELTDQAGRSAGTLRLPPEDEQQAPELCEPATDGILAASLTEASGGRQIINVPDCGAKRLRFLWTAPASDIGPVWFAGSAVWSDGQADPYHDGVTDFGRVLSADGVASVTTAGCSVSTQARGPGAALVLLLAALCWARRCRAASK
ncbi:MAG TPA: hypothetical protein VJR89_42140, partial [Polyangiales bacterium]|nr:hypothetical protein [Polyangiales bacterium]